MGFTYALPGEALTPAGYPENRNLAFRWGSIMLNGKSFTSRLSYNQPELDCIVLRRSVTTLEAIYSSLI